MCDECNGTDELRAVIRELLDRLMKAAAATERAKASSEQVFQAAKNDADTIRLLVQERERLENEIAALKAKGE